MTFNSEIFVQHSHKASDKNHGVPRLVKILLVAPNGERRDSLYRCLTGQNLVVDGADDGETAWHQLQTFLYDVIVLEAVAPGIDGPSLCRRLRKVGNPLLILLLVDAGDSETLAHGLECGADVCLAKPFTEKLLLANLRALARSRGFRRAKPTLSWGGLRLDPTARRVTCSGQELTVNRKEYQLLELFLSQPKQVFSQSDIADRLWTLDEQLPTQATVRSHMRSLRRKLEKSGHPELIQTRYGQGYCLDPSLGAEARTVEGKRSSTVAPMDNITANFWQEAMAANARLREEIERREQVEAQLRRSDAMLRTAQKVAQIGCWEYDIKTRQIFWTDELFDIHGLTPGPTAPNHDEVLALTHPDDLEIHEREVVLPAQRGQAFEANLRIVRANDGQVRTVNARGGPVFDASGAMVKITGTTFDITRWVSEAGGG
jgi:DNA-binding response OmpR family regulator